MDFLNRLLNRPTSKPAICHRPPTPREGASEPASTAATLPAVPARPRSTDQFSRETSEAVASSSGPSSLAQESLSSASSFQSLASTLSSKSSSGICVDSAPGSPDKTVFDHSYVNVDIPELDDLISACANINLNSALGAALGVIEGEETDDKVGESPDSSADLSHDQTFASAADDTLADETAINIHIEESIQTFKTCPVLEATQVSTLISSTTAVFKAPLPIVVDQSSSSESLSSSSVIPYLSFEDSVLRKHQGDEPEFKSALTSFQPLQPAISPRTRVSLSPTPCIEIDVAEVLKNRTKSEATSEGSFTSSKDTVDVDSSFVDVQEQEEQHNSAGLDTPDTTFEQGQALDSTVILGLESESTVNASEKLNSTEFLSALPATNLNVTVEVETQNKDDVNKKESEISVPDEVVQKEVETDEINPDIVSSEEISKILNDTQVITKLTNSEKTEVTQQENVSNEFEVILQDKNDLNKTEIVEKIETPNEEVVIQVKNNLNKTNVILEEQKSLNKTESVQPTKTPNKTDEFVQKPNKSLSKSPVNVLSVQEINELNEIHFSEQKNAQESIRIDELFNKNESLKTIPEETSIIQDISSKNSQIQPKTPVAVSVINFKVPNPNNSELFSTEDSQHSNSLNNEVVASTPIPTKAVIKEEPPATPKSKSALFVKEPESPRSPGSLSVKEYKAIKEEENNRINFDETVVVNKTFDDNFEAAVKVLHDNSLNLLQQEPEYEAFKPKQQSTTLPFPDFKVLQEAALSVAKDIDTSLEKFEESEQFVSATNELFEDPSALDFLSQIGSQTSRRGERYDSLFMKFDPLAQRQSMLPQKNLPNSPSVDEEVVKETKANTPITNMGTPKKNPALAAIDRLLFYSPQTPAPTESEVAEAKQKKEEAEKPEPQLTPVVDEKMAKELELVRSTVLQLEAEIEKQKQEHKEQLDRQKMAFEEKVNHIQTKFAQMQSQLTQEVKCKDQMTVVVEEYEKSISRLIAEREKDRTNFEGEKAKLQEELQIANQHLSNTEAAFTDVHSKYERLKNVVSAYKSNETVLKESIAENQETIKTLENRYEQLKGHAMAQLEKANLELSAIRKHNEAENVKLKALVRKAELKSKSLEETVEQKIKENKELTQIIDEMIARVE